MMAGGRGQRAQRWVMDHGGWAPPGLRPHYPSEPRGSEAAEDGLMPSRLTKSGSIWGGRKKERAHHGHGAPLRILQI